MMVYTYITYSMKRGRIVSVSHDIPEESPFKTYRDLKRHWKNTVNNTKYLHILLLLMCSGILIFTKTLTQFFLFNCLCVEGNKYKYLCKGK